jgi:hypothetical protein
MIRQAFDDLNDANFTYKAAVFDAHSSVLMAVTGITDRHRANRIVDYLPHIRAMQYAARAFDLIGENLLRKDRA